MAPAVKRELAIQYGAVAVTSVAPGTGVYTLTLTAPSWLVTGGLVTFFGHASAANNGTFSVTSVAGAVVTTDNAASVGAAPANGFACIQVGGTTLSGNSDYMLHQKYKEDRAYLEATLTFTGVVSHPTAATFGILCNSIEQVFRTPRARFRILLESTVLRDYIPTAGATGNTGFDAEPSIRKLGEDKDSGRSREYEIQIRVALPADLAGQNGRASSTSEVSIEPSGRQILTISGRYTALTTNDAVAQYQANIAAFASSQQSLMMPGVTTEKISETFSINDTNKSLDFNRVYVEILFNQDLGVLDDTNIVDATFNFTRAQTAPGDSDSGARRLEPISASFDAWIAKSVTDLEAEWQNGVRPYILAQVQSQFHTSQVAIVDTQVNLERKQNRITGTLQLLAVARDGGALIESDLTVEVSNNPGNTLVPVWTDDPLAYHQFQGPQVVIRTRSERNLILGSSGGGGGGFVGGGGGIGGLNPAFVGFGGTPGIVGLKIAGVGFGGTPGASFDFGPGGPGGGGGNGAAGQEATSPIGAFKGSAGYVLLTDTESEHPITKGVDGKQISMVERTRVIVEQLIKPVTGGGGSTETETGDKGGTPTKATGSFPKG